MAVDLVRERVARAQWAAAGLALIGLALAAGLAEPGARAAQWSTSYLVGLAMCLGGSLSYAAVTLIAKSSQGVSAFALALGQCVVGVVMLTRGPAETPAVSSLAQVAPVAAPITAATSASPLAVVAEAPALVANGKLIRDARLDRYLAAHKQFAGSSALGVPSGYLRNATALEGER